MAEINRAHVHKHSLIIFRISDFLSGLTSPVNGVRNAVEFVFKVNDNAMHELVRTTDTL